MRASSRPKPSVLHVYKDYYPPVFGGIEKCIHWMADQTRREFHVRVLVASRSRRLVDETIDGVRVVRVGCLGRALSSPLAPGFPAWLRRLDSDILHFHMPNPVGELAYLTARPPRGRVLATYHSDIVRQKISGRLYGPLQQAFLGRAARIHPTSQRYLDSSATLAPHRARCEPLPLGLPLADYAETEASRGHRREFEERFGDQRRIVFLGMLRYYKGLHRLIEALAALPEDCVLLLGGSGPERPRLEEQARRAGLAERVVFLGEISHERAVGLLHAGHVFCLPSHLRAEAFGLCQIEAMACGLPLVSCDLDTGVPELNRDGENGLVVPPDDAGALAGALGRLLGDETLRRRLGEAGRALAERAYDAPVMGERLAASYRRLLAAPGESDEAAGQQV